MRILDLLLLALSLLSGGCVSRNPEPDDRPAYRPILMALLRFCCNGLGLQQFTRRQRATWQAVVRRMAAAGFAPVLSYNPYWDQHGRTFEDPDGYRVVLQRAKWSL